MVPIVHTNVAIANVVVFAYIIAAGVLMDVKLVGRGYAAIKVLKSLNTLFMSCG